MPLDPEDKRTKLLEKIALCVEKTGERLVLCGGMAAFLICEAAKVDAQVVLTEDADLVIKRRFQFLARDYSKSNY